MQFTGYRRGDGRVGSRNLIAVLPLSYAAKRVTDIIAVNVPAAVCLPHGLGMGSSEQEVRTAVHVLNRLLTNPNYGGVILVALEGDHSGMEAVTCPDREREGLLSRVTIGTGGGTATAVTKIVMAVRAQVKILENQPRSLVAVRDLVVGFCCEVRTNPGSLAGIEACCRLAERLAAKGATSVFCPESEGALRDYGVRSKAGWMPKEVAYAQAIEPPGQEGDSRDLSQRSVSDRILLMRGPSHMGQAATGLVACGANVLVVTTDFGNPAGFPGVPVVKITANPKVKSGAGMHIDVYVGKSLPGQPDYSDPVDRLLTVILEAVSGKLTRSQELHHEELFQLPYSLDNPAAGQ